MTDDMSDGERGGTETEEDTSRYVRLQVEVVLEITDAEELTGAALRRIDSEEYLPDDERAHAQDAVRRDEAEALAYLVDPFDLFGEVPGVELLQASWSSAHADYDPDEEEWDVYEEELTEGDE